MITPPKSFQAVNCHQAKRQTTTVWCEPAQVIGHRGFQRLQREKLTEIDTKTTKQVAGEKRKWPANGSLCLNGIFAQSGGNHHSHCSTHSLQIMSFGFCCDRMTGASVDWDQITIHPSLLSLSPSLSFPLCLPLCSFFPSLSRTVMSRCHWDVILLDCSYLRESKVHFNR